MPLNLEIAMAAVTLAQRGKTWTQARERIGTRKARQQRVRSRCGVVKAQAGWEEVARVADAAATTASKGTGGPFGFVAKGLEVFLKEVHGVFEEAGVKYSYGWAIITLTVLVKAATFPLTKKQVESTNAMQALQPKVQELQQKYSDDQQRLQLETSKLYRKAQVNPLAGCLPTLVTLPIWIGLYRALTNVANEGLLSEGFFWIPSLAGPVTLADRASGGGLKWLFPLENGEPPIGWHDAIAYLVLPFLLVVSQIISQQYLSPQSQQSQNKSANIILKILPLFLGWLALNVPSGLSLYWFTNNLLSTAQSVFLRKTLPTPSIPDMSDDSSSSSSQSSPSREYVEASVNKSKPAKSRGQRFEQLKAQERSSQPSSRSLPADPEPQSDSQQESEERAS